MSKFPFPVALIHLSGYFVCFKLIGTLPRNCEVFLMESCLKTLKKRLLSTILGTNCNSLPLNDVTYCSTSGTSS